MKYPKPSDVKPVPDDVPDAVAEPLTEYLGRLPGPSSGLVREELPQDLRRLLEEQNWPEARLAIRRAFQGQPEVLCAKLGRSAVKSAQKRS